MICLSHKVFIKDLVETRSTVDKLDTHKIKNKFKILFKLKIDLQIYKWNLKSSQEKILKLKILKL